MKKKTRKTRTALYLLTVLLLIVSMNTNVFAAKTHFPTKGWQTTTPEEQGMQSAILAQMIEEIENKSYHVDSVTIVRNGYMILDAYFHPFAKGNRHYIHSCTKSVMSALVGIAIEKGYIDSVRQSIFDLLPHKKIANLDARKQAITLEDLLLMASGLECRDSYLYGWKGLREMRVNVDWAQYVLDLPMAEPPGERFEYCNGVSHLLSVIIRNATKMETFDFARKHLFAPLSIVDVSWSRSPDGVDIGYGTMWLNPHDMAKLGWLYLNKGRWDGRQIVPAAWVAASTKGQIDATLFDQYGYQWWVDSSGYYAAVGYKGQRIFVVPDKNLVAIFTADLIFRNGLLPKKLLENYIIPAAVSSGSLPANPVENKRLHKLQVGISQEPAKGLIWFSETEGIAQDGVFKRVAAPGFRFEYPAGSKKTAIDYAGQVLNMVTPADVAFSASVMDIPDGVHLKDFGPSVYALELEKHGSDIKVISNREIKLKCGTKAYRTDIVWLWNSKFKLTSVVVSAYKGDACVFLAIHPMGDPEIYAPIVESLSFNLS